MISQATAAGPAIIGLLAMVAAYLCHQLSTKQQRSLHVLGSLFSMLSFVSFVFALCGGGTALPAPVNSLFQQMTGALQSWSGASLGPF